MSNRVLALKYRPQGFEDVVGQETTVRILENVIKEKKDHHAYLLTGPRGVGKTSLARIFAKALNCEKGPTTEICQACSSCREITESRSLSVLEIDGASNTSVDDVRELREKIRYLPPGGRYKIYIIDEVHMLSNAAFNALLKTLEEPPPHALFVFATTEPQKVPITVISRCLRFDLKPITVAAIVKRLADVAAREGIGCDEDALFEMARQSAGGLRDALGLLDQAATFAGDRITLKTVEEILGSSPRRFIIKMVQGILQREPRTVLEELGAIHQAGIEPKRFALEFLETLRHLLVARTTDDPSLFDLAAEEVKTLRELSGRVSEESLDHLFQMLQKGLPDLLRSPQPRILLDVLMLRLCRYQDLESIPSLLKRLEGVDAGHGERDLDFEKLPAPPPIVSVSESKSWGGFLKKVSLTRPQLSSILEQAAEAAIHEGGATIAYPPSSIHLEMLKDEDRQKQLQTLLEQYVGRPIRIDLVERSVPVQKKNVIDEAVSIFQPLSVKTIPPP